MDNHKLKVYLDTSVISYLKQDDAPEKTKITNALWDKFKIGMFDIYISDITMLEIEECPLNKRLYLFDRINEIEYTLLKLDNTCSDLSKEIISLGILKEKSIDDSYHIAIALKNECQVIISWNFKHLVNIKTIDGVRAIANIKNYRNINIVTPETLLNMEV